MSELWTPRGIHTSQRKRRWYEVSTDIIQQTFPQWKPKRMEAYQDGTGLRVILTEETSPPDSRHWLHISVSRDERYPTWEELLAVKEEFIGEEEEAYQVLPKASQYVNVHNFCFHIWRCLDGDIMPQ